MVLKTEEIADPAFLGSIFLEVEQAFLAADYTSTLEPFLSHLEGSHASHFAAQSNPIGTPWAPLAASTIARKGHDTILVETTRLKSSLTGKTQDSIRAVSHRGLLFGTEVPYAIFHQDGGRLPKREHVGMNNETTQQIVDAVADRTVEELKMK